MQSSQAVDTERKIVQNHLENKQSTHKTEAENSLAMAIPLLLKNLLPGHEKDQQTLDQVAAVVLKDLSELKEEKILENLRDTAKKQLKGDILPAIQKIIDIANEPLHPLLDTVTLYLKDPSSQTYKKIAHQFPIKYVLMLVYHAIFSEREKDQNQFITGAKDQKHRIESFYLCLLQIKNDPRCHTGTRNRLLALLNGSYKGIELIEDVPSKICETIKEEINTQYWSLYDKETNNNKKKCLYNAYVTWLATNSPVELLKLLDNDIKNTIVKKLEGLLIANGIDPKDYKLDKKINEALQELEFTPDSKNPQYDAALIAMKEIMDEDATKKNGLSTQALVKIQDWIRNGFDVENENHRNKINLFLKAYDSYKKLKAFYLPISLILSESEVIKISAQINAFFQSITSEESKGGLSPSELEKTISNLSKAIQNAKQDSMTSYIENFFAKIFMDNLAQDAEKKQAYQILFDKEMQKKMILNDEQLEKMKTIADGNYQDITPYQINRIFLHAIINKPENWSEKFYSEFKRVLAFVKEFKDDSNPIKKDLFAASYKPRLINQLDYLNQIKAGEDKAERPHPMILSPDQVTSLDEWHHLCAPFNEEECKKLYAENRLTVNKLACDGFFKTLRNAMTANHYHFNNKIDSLKTDDDHNSCIKAIMDKFNKEEITSKKIEYALRILHNARIVYGPINLQIEKLFFTHASPALLKKMVDNYAEFEYNLARNTEIMFQKIGKDLKEKVNNYDDLKKHFLIYSANISNIPLNAITNHFEEKEMIRLVSNIDQLKDLMFCLELKDRMPLLNYLGSRHVTSLITSAEALYEFGKRCTPDELPDFINFLGKKWFEDTINTSFRLSLFLGYNIWNSYPYHDVFIKFIQKLDKKYLSTIIKTIQDLTTIFNDKESLGKIHLCLSPNHLRSIITNTNDLAEILLKLNADNYLTFLNHLGLEYVKSLINTPTHMMEMLKKLDNNNLGNNLCAFKIAIGDEYIASVLSKLQPEDFVNNFTKEKIEAKHDYDDDGYGYEYTYTVTTRTLLEGQITRCLTKEDLKQMFPTLDSVKAIFPRSNFCDDRKFILSMLKQFDSEHLRSFFPAIKIVTKFISDYNFPSGSWSPASSGDFLELLGDSHVLSLANSSLAENDITTLYSEEKRIQLIIKQVISLLSNPETNHAAAKLYNIIKDFDSRINCNEKIELGEISATLLIALANKNGAKCKALANELKGKPSPKMQALGIALMALGTVLIALAIAATIASFGLAAPATIGMGVGGGVSILAGLGIFRSNSRRYQSKALYEVGKVLKQEESKEEKHREEKHAI